MYNCSYLVIWSLPNFNHHQSTTFLVSITYVGSILSYSNQALRSIPAFWANSASATEPGAGR